MSVVLGGGRIIDPNSRVDEIGGRLVHGGPVTDVGGTIEAG